MAGGWREHLADDIELMAVQFPGRETRTSEPAMESLVPLRRALEQVIPPLMELPMALFGYSMGASVALEVAREMAQVEMRPCHMFVAAAGAPQLNRRIEPVSHLPDDAFVEAIRQHFGGIPPEVAEHEELLKLLLPPLRADIHIIETSEYQHDDPLPCPITSIGGSDDRVVSLADLAAWGEQTTAAFSHRLYPGGHFFIRQRLPQVLRLVNERLADVCSH